MAPGQSNQMLISLFKTKPGIVATLKLAHCSNESWADPFSTVGGSEGSYSSLCPGKCMWSASFGLCVSACSLGICTVGWRFFLFDGCQVYPLLHTGDLQPSPIWLILNALEFMFLRRHLTDALTTFSYTGLRFLVRLFLCCWLLLMASAANTEGSRQRRMSRGDGFLSTHPSV